MIERTPQDFNQDEPLDPAVERVRAKLMRFAVINLGILFLALMAVVGALVYRAVSTESAPHEVSSGTLPLPPEGSIITGIKLAEKEIPDDTPNAGLAKLDAALRLHLEL